MHIQERDDNMQQKHEHEEQQWDELSRKEYNEWSQRLDEQFMEIMTNGSI